ncbi:MAG: hypothetical protein QOF58_1939 [Pseudonocardiales bacterium]|jgi:hypothetical protein|nr:hypothetical protein [Pseudonocardiales bacterium]
MEPSDPLERPATATGPGGPEGRYVYLNPPGFLWRAVEVVSKKLTAEQAQALKIHSGEHLALLLTTAVLTTAPMSIDTAGGHDLVFDLANREPQATPAVELGMTEHPYADFEIKSLPGGFREFNAGIDRAERAGRPPRQPGFGATVRSVNDILALEGRQMIDAARAQLERKAQTGHSRNIFLIAHLLEHPAVEPIAGHVIAHMLEPLTDLHDIATVWLLWAPTHLVLWSTATQTWTDVMFAASDIPNDPDLRFDSDLDLLQDVEDEFLNRIGHTTGSPYLFRIEATGSEQPRPDGAEGEQA